MKTITVQKAVQVGDVLQNIKTKEKIVFRQSDFGFLNPEEWEFVDTCYCVNQDES